VSAANSTAAREAGGIQGARRDKEVVSKPPLGQDASAGGHPVGGVQLAPSGRERCLAGAGDRRLSGVTLSVCSRPRPSFGPVPRKLTFKSASIRARVGYLLTSWTHASGQNRAMVGGRFGAWQLLSWARHLRPVF
jgi:hypothetical protein